MNFYAILLVCLFSSAFGQHENGIDFNDGGQVCTYLLLFYKIIIVIVRIIYF